MHIPGLKLSGPGKVLQPVRRRRRYSEASWVPIISTSGANFKTNFTVVYLVNYFNKGNALTEIFKKLPIGLVFLVQYLVEFFAWTR